MADRYWVGGSGTWNTTSTTNWSATSGGASGASVPTTADNVIFDQAGTYTVTMTGALNCLNFTVSAGAVTYATGTTPTLTVAGSMSLITGTVWNSTGTITANSTGSRTFTTAGTVFSCDITVDGTGGTFTLGNNLSLANTRTFTFNGGSLVLNNNILTTGLFSTSTTTTRVLNFGTSGKIVVNNNATNVVFSLTTTSYTTQGTPLVEVTGGGGSGVTKTIRPGNLNEANALSFTFLDGAGTNIQWDTSNNFRNIVVSPAAGGLNILNNATLIYGDLTITDVFGGTATLASGNQTWTFAATSGTKFITTDGVVFNNPVTVNAPGATYSLSDSFTTGSTRAFTLTAGTLNLNGFTLTAGTFVSTGSTARNINFSNNGQIVVTGNNTTVFDVTNATNYSTTGTPYIRSTYTGATGTRTFNAGFSLAQSVGYNISTTGTSGIVIGTTATDSFTITGNWGTLDLTGFTNTLNNANSFTLYGDLIIPASGGTLATAGVIYTITLSGPGSQTINTNGRSLPYSINLEATGSYTLANNWSQTSSNSHTFELRAGTLNLSSYTLTTAGFFCTTTGVKNLNFDTGKISAINTATNTVFQISSSATNLTVTGTNPLVEFSGGGTSVTKTIVSNGLSEANSISMSFLDTSATVTYQITSTGTNTVRNILFNGIQTINNNAGLTVYGNWTHQTSGGTTTFTAGTNAWTFASTSGTKTITSPAGFTYDFPWTFNGVGGTWQLQNNVTIGSTRTLTLTAGTLDLNNFIFTAGSLSSSNSNTRVLAFGSTGQLALVGNNTTIIDLATVTNFSYTGILYINSTYTGATGTRTINFGGTAGATVSNVLNVACTGTSGIIVGTAASDIFALTGSFNNINLTGITNTLSNTTRTVYGNLTIPASGGVITPGTNTMTFVTSTTQTIDTNGISLGYDLAFTGTGTYTLLSNLTLTPARAITHTTGTVSLDTFTITVGFWSSNATTVKGLNFGTSGKIVCNPSTGGFIWNVNYTNLTVTGSNPLVEFTGGGTGIIKTIVSDPVTEANAISFSLLETTGSVTYEFYIFGNNGVKNLLINGTQTVTNNRGPTIFGNYTYSTTNGTTTFTAGSNVWTFAGSGSKTITTLGTVHDFPWTFNGSGSTWTLQDNLSINAKALTFTNGTLDVNNKTVTSGAITINGGSFTLNNTGGTTLSTNQSITHTSGTFTLGTNFTTTNASGYTFTAGILALGTSTLTTPIFSSNNNNARTLNFGTGKIVLNGTTTITIWNTNTATGLVVSGTPLVECIGGGTAVTKTINTGNTAISTEAQAISFSLLETTGTVTYAFTANNTVRDLLIQGTQTISNIAITIYGNYTEGPTGTTTFTAGTNAWTFAATSGTKTITNRFVKDFPLIFNGIGGTWQIVNNLNIGAKALTWTNGTLDTNNVTITSGAITINGNFTLANSAGTEFTTTQAVTQTTGTFALNTRFNIQTQSGYTLTAGTLQLNSFVLNPFTFTSSNTNTRTIAFGTGKIIITNGTTTTIWNTGTVTNLTITGTPVVECGGGGSTPVKTINSGALTEANAISFYFLDAAGTPTYTFTAGNTVKDLYIFPNGALSCTISNIAITIFGNFTHLGTVTTFTAGTNAWTFASTSGVKTITLPTAGITYDFPWTFNGVGGTWQLQNNNLTLGSTRAFTLTNGTFDFNNWTVSGPTSGITINGGTVGIVNTAGTLSTALPITHTAGTLNLTQNLTTTSASGYTLTAGTLVLSTFTLTALVFSSNNANTRSINFGTGKIVLNASTTSTIWNMATLTGFTVTGTPLVECIGGGSAITKTINPGSATEAQSVSFSLLETTGTVTYTFSAGSNVRSLVVNGVQTLSNTAMSIFGAFTHQTTNGTTTFTAGTGVWTFAATSGNYTINNIAGFTYDWPWTFGSATSTAVWTLANNLTLGATRLLRIANGTLDFNSKTVSASSIDFNTGTPSIANTGSSSFTTALPITVSSGTFTLPFDVTTTSTTVANGFNLTGGTINLSTYTLTARTIYSSGSTARTLNFGTGKIVINATTTSTIWDTTTSTNLTISGTPLVECIGGGTGVTKTITTGTGVTEANTVSFSLLETTGTVTYSITASGRVRNLLVNGVQTINNTGFDIFGSFTHLNTNGTTTFTAGTNILSFRATSGNWNISPLSGFTYDFPWQIGATAASTAVWTLTGNIALGATRIFYFANGIFDFNTFTVTAGSQYYLVSGAMRLRNTGGATITTTLPLTVDAAGGSLTLDANFTTTAAGTAVALTTGTLSLNNFVLTTPIFNSSGSGVRVLAFGTTGQVVVNGNNATVVEMSTMNNFTYTGNPSIISSYTGSVGTRTFNFGTTSGATATNVFNVATTGTAGLVIGTTATDSITLAGSFNDMNFTGFTNTLNSATRILYGNLVMPATGGTFVGGGSYNFFATVSRTITSNGRTIDSNITFNGTGGTWTLQDALTVGSTRLTTLTAGTLALGAFTLTTGQFNGSGGTARTINFGTGKIVLNGSTTTTVWDTSTPTSLTYVGTPLVECTGGGTGVTKTISTSSTTAEASTFSFSLLETTGTVTYAFSNSAAIRNLLVNGTQTVSNVSIFIYGDFTHLTTNGTTTFTAGANIFRFSATSGTVLINNLAGFTYDFPWTFGNNASTATWQLQNNLTLGATRQLTLVTGTLDFNSKTLSSAGITISNSVGTVSIANTGSSDFTTAVPLTQSTGTFTLPFNVTTTSTSGYAFNATTLSLGSFTLTTPAFLSGVTNNRTLNFGTGKIVLNGNTTATIYNMNETTLTVTGTPLVECIGGGTGVTKTITAGPVSEAQSVSFSLLETTGTVTYSMAGRIRNFIINGSQTVTNGATLFIYGSFTHLNTNGTTNITASANSWTFNAGSGTRNINTLTGFTYDFPWTFGFTGAETATYVLGNNLTLGSTRALTLTAGTLDLNNFTSTAATLSSNNSNTRQLSFGTTGQMTLGASSGTVIDFTTMTGFTYIGTPRIICGGGVAAGTRTFNIGGTAGATATNVFDLSIGTSGTGIVVNSVAETVTFTGNYNNINFTGLTNTVSNSVTSIWGNLTVPGSGGAFTAGANTWTFVSTTARTINTNNRLLDFPVTFNGVGGSWALQSNYQSGTGRLLTLTAGTMNLNNFNFSIGTLSSTNSNLRTLAFGSTGQIVLAGSTTTVVDITNMINFTYTGTPYINNSTGTGARSYVFGSSGGAFPDNVFNVNRTGTSGLVIGTAADSFTLTGSFGDIDFTGFGGTLTNTARTAYGNVIIPATGTFTAGTAVTTLAAPATTVANGYSIGFNGTSDFLSLTGNAVFAIPTSTTPFTIECWVYPQAAGSAIFTEVFTGSGNSIPIAITLSDGTDVSVINGLTVCFGWYTGAAWVTAAGANTALTVNSWTHVACVFTGSTSRIYYNGVNVTKAATPTPAATWGVTNVNGDGWYIGRRWDAGVNTYFNGFISNFRFTNGVAVYTGNFTPSTSPLTTTSQGVSAANVSLLTCQAQTYIDNSLNNLSISRNGTVFISQQSPFATSTIKTITSNGRTLDFPITVGDLISGSGTNRLADALTLGTTRTLTLAVNTLDFNNLTATANAFVSNTIANRTMSFSTTGQLTLSGSGATIWNSNIGTNFNTSGTKRVFASYNSTVGTRVIDFGNIPEAATFNFFWASSVIANSFTMANSAGDTLTLRGAINDFNNANYSGLLFSDANRTLYGNWNTINGTSFTWTQGGSSNTTLAATQPRTVATNGSDINVNFIMNSTSTITLATSFSPNDFVHISGTMDLNGQTFSPWTYNASGTTSRTLAFGNTGVSTLQVFSSNNTTPLNIASATNFNWTGIAKIFVANVTTSNAANTRTILLGNTAPFDNPNLAFGMSFANITSAAYLSIPNNYITVRSSSVDRLNILGQVGDFDLRGSNNTILNNPLTVYGSLYANATGTLTAGANTMTLAGLANNLVIDVTSKLPDFPITVNATGNYSFANNFSLATGRAFTLTSGNLIINNVTVSLTNVSTSSSNIRSLNFPGTTGQINLSANGTTVWNSNNGANFSFSGNVIINSTYTSNVGTRVFDFGNIVESNAPNVKITTGTVGFNIGTANDSVTLTGGIGDLNLTGLLATVTNTSRTVYGNITIPATGGTFTAGTTATVLGSTIGTKTIDTANRSLAFPLTFNGVGGNWTLANGLAANATTVLTLANGQVNFNQRVLTFANITIAGGATGNAGLSNLNTTLAMVHTSGNLTILTGAITSTTTNTYALSGGVLNVSANFSTGAFTHTGGNIIL